MKELISVIIPVYNGEENIKRCIDSVLSQSYENIEIIAVNDGSTDSSRSILDIYSKIDQRVKAVHIQNGGVSNARNVGIDAANGKYIMFLDCDDWMAEDTVKLLYESMDSECDMTQCSYKTVDEHGNCIGVWDVKDAVYENEDDILCAFFDIQILQCCWAKLYRAELLSDIRFDKRFAVGEDDYFSYRVCQRAKKVKTVSLPLINYYENQSSVMHSKLAPKHFQIFDVLDIQLSENKDNDRVYRRCAVKDIKISNMHLWRMFSENEMLSMFERLKNRISAHKKIIMSCSDLSLREKGVFMFLIYMPKLYYKLKKGK